MLCCQFSALILGLTAMTITMAVPDNLEYYAPVFHANSLWFAAAGGFMIKPAAK